MKIEGFILISITVISLVSLIYIPRNKIRISLLAFSVFHTASWLVSILLVELGVYEFPVREFIKSTRVNFIPQFLFYPLIFTWFILLYPRNRSFLFLGLHWIIFISIPLWFVYFTEKYTNLYKLPGNKALTFVLGCLGTFILRYVFSFLFVNWFFKEKRLL